MEVPRPGVVSGVPRQRPPCRLASDSPAVDPAAATEGFGGERLAAAHAAVVDEPVVKRLVQVKIKAQVLAVVQDEVPRTVVTPRVHPVDPRASDCHDQAAPLARPPTLHDAAAPQPTFTSRDVV